MKHKKIPTIFVMMLMITTLFTLMPSIKAASDLADAVDNEDITWESPNDEFFWQTDTHYYGGDAAECEDTGGNLHGEVLDSKGTLSFYCLATCGSDDDGWEILFWIRIKNGGGTVPGSSTSFPAEVIPNPDDDDWIYYEFTLDETADYEFIWMFSDFAGDPDTGNEIGAWVDKVGWTGGSNDNNPPTKPTKPSGPGNAETNEEVTFTTSSTDQDGDQIYYKFDWDANGAGDQTGWLGPYDSGETISKSHTWDATGTYVVKVRAKDTNDATSSWSSGKTITIGNNIEEFTLTINTQGQGMVNKNPDKNKYNDGETVTLTANPMPGWSFDHWSGDATGSINPRIITMNRDKTITAHFVEQQSDDLRWVVMCYFAGDNDLFTDLFQDIREMEEVGSSDNVKFVVLFDGSGNGDSRLLEIAKNTLNLPGIISPDLDDNGYVIPSSNEVNMGDPNTLIDFCNWVKSISGLYDDADRYCLVLNDHGNSWKPDGSFSDHTSNDELDIFELKNAISSISSNGADKIDVLAFDACLMASVEVMYDMQNYVNYMVASEEYMPGSGFSYDLICQDLVDLPSMSPNNLCEIIVDHYDGFTLSAVKFDEHFDRLIDAIDALVYAISALANKEASRDALWNVIFDVETYDLLGFLDMVDLYDMCEKVKVYFSSANIHTICNLIMSLISNGVVKYNNVEPLFENSHGISIYMPGFFVDEDIEKDYFEYYKTINFAQNTQWDEIIEFYSGEDDDISKNVLPRFFQRFNLRTRFSRISNLLIAIQSILQRITINLRK